MSANYYIVRSRIVGQFRIHYGDLTDSNALTNIVAEISPTEIYNLAAQSNVKVKNSNNILVALEFRLH